MGAIIELIVTICSLMWSMSILYMLTYQTQLVRYPSSSIRSKLACCLDLWFWTYKIINPTIWSWSTHCKTLTKFC